MRGRKTKRLLAGFLVSMVIVPEAQAAIGGWTVGLNAGVGIPISRHVSLFGAPTTILGFKDAANTGYMGGISLGRAITRNLIVGVDGALTVNDGSDRLNAALTTSATLYGPDGILGNADDGTTTIVRTGQYNLLQGSVHAKLMMSNEDDSRIGSYLLLGAGVCNFKLNTESSHPVYRTERSENAFSARGGLGMEYKASESVKLGVEGALHYVHRADDPPWFIGILTGASVGFGRSE